MRDTDPMPFGIHKDKPMQDVPASYLLWLWNEGCRHEGVKGYIKDALGALQQECPDVIVKPKP